MCAGPKVSVQRLSSQSEVVFNDENHNHSDIAEIESKKIYRQMKTAATSSTDTSKSSIAQSTSQITQSVSACLPPRTLPATKASIPGFKALADNYFTT